MQQYPTILPPPALPDGTVPERSKEKEANLVRFQAELEVRKFQAELIPSLSSVSPTRSTSMNCMFRNTLKTLRF